jgi:hypothetical protein
MRWVLIIAALVACHAKAPSPRDEQATLLTARDRDDVAAMRAHAWSVFTRIQREWPAWPRSDVVFGRPDRILRPLQPFRDRGRLVREQLPIMFAVAFDPVAAQHIRRNRLAARAGLTAFTAAVPDFPRDATAIKLVWYPVHAHRRTTLPVWDDAPARRGGNPDTTWRRRVPIDVNDFIHAELHAGPELAAARAASGDPTLEPGDHVVLIGMHVSTKEIPDWVWATFWWHDRPDAGPYAAGRPPQLAGAAAHYLMDVAYSDARPCMNPWLEARFPGGTTSNCLACHQRAALGATAYLPVARAVLPAGDPYFRGKITTDFVWSLALEAR